MTTQEELRKELQKRYMWGNESGRLGFAFEATTDALVEYIDSLLTLCREAERERALNDAKTFYVSGESFESFINSLTEKRKE